MIDLGEDLVTLPQASRRLPGRPHPGTIYRWANPGLREGRVRLEVLRIGGRLKTSIEALERFFRRLGENDEDHPKLVSPAAAGRSEHDNAEARAEELGI